MKIRLWLISVLAICLSGCSVLSPKGEVASLESQTFNTNIPGETIKIDKSCGWFWNRKKCNIESITAVGVQVSAGGGVFVQGPIGTMACDNARVNVVSYVFGENVRSRRQSSTRMGQGENQKDTGKNESVFGNEGSQANTESKIRQALTDTNIDFIKTMSIDTQGRLVGFAERNREVIDGRTIACTIVWSRRDSEDLRKIRSLVAGY